MKDIHGQGIRDLAPKHPALPPEMQEYSQAIAPKTFPEGIDDRKTVMHPARYAGPAVDPLVHYKFMPMEISCPYTWLDMNYVGVPTQDPRVMKWVQSRASRKLSKLDLFADVSLRKMTKKKRLHGQ